MMQVIISVVTFKWTENTSLDSPGGRSHELVMIGHGFDSRLTVAENGWLSHRYILVSWARFPVQPHTFSSLTEM
jgi:hypothetical protein